MSKRKIIVFWTALVFLTVANSGCALVGAAITAGISYGIYQATK